MNNESDKKTDLNVCGNTTNTCTPVSDNSPTSASTTAVTVAATPSPSPIAVAGIAITPTIATTTIPTTTTATSKSRNLIQPSTSSSASLSSSSSLSFSASKKKNSLGMTKKSCKNFIGGSGSNSALHSTNINQNNKNFNKNNLKNQKNSDSCVNSSSSSSSTTINATTTTTCGTVGNFATSANSSSSGGGGGIGVGIDDNNSCSSSNLNGSSGGANANGKNVSKLATTAIITSSSSLTIMAAVATGNNSCATTSSLSSSSSSSTLAPIASTSATTVVTATALPTKTNNLGSSKKSSSSSGSGSSSSNRQQHHHKSEQMHQHQQQQQQLPPPPLPRQQHQQTSTDICGGCVSIGVGGGDPCGDAENAVVSAPNSGSHPVAVGDCNAQSLSPASSSPSSSVAIAAAVTQTTSSSATAAGLNQQQHQQQNSSCSNSSSNSSLSSSSVGNGIANALQNIASDNSDTETEVIPPKRVTDVSESDEESVSEILLACLCLRPDLLESDPDSCGNDGEGNDDEDDGDDEEEDEDDELQDPSEMKFSGNFPMDSSMDSSQQFTALFEAAAHDKAPVLRHATHAIDETKQALTKMRCASSPRDKTIFSRTLIAACNDNDVNTVRRLLGKGNININESTDDGESLLSMACSAGYYELAQVLLAMSAAQVEDKGQKDCTPLMEAASAGHLDIVKLLLSHKADVNAHCATGNTPLMFACAGGHCDVVKELLKHGANVEEQNENGHTPLMEAASAGHVEVAKILLEHGAGINTHSNEFKESALTLACYKGHLNMVRFLLQAGADQEHKTDEMHTALMEASMDGHVEVARLLLDSGAQVNMPTDSFESPLTLAACGGHVELATLLIERGANIEEVNDEGYTPLMEAAREGHEEMVALLLNKGANINATTEETQETALTLACCGGFMEVAEFLIKEGANLELGASTPLMEAAQEGHTDLVKFLLENKANVHAETQTGDTALTHAAENGHTDAAEVLLNYGAELEHESEGGRTPLMKACRAGHLCTVKFLIQKGADVNKQTTSNDHTPLSLACAGGHQAVVELLLKSGADPYHKLKDNSTMLIEAAKGGHTRVVELLFKYPHLMQNHQNELQTNGINNAANTAGQLPLINMQQQKQFQQQLLQLSAPPGLHEVPEAVRVSNQQLFNQQQFTSVDYLDEPFIANATEGFAIDPNTLNAQQQEALIAKSRLFHCFEPGFAHGVRPPSGIVNQLISNNNTPATPTVNQTHANSNTANNSTATATTTTSSNTNTIKQKSLLRKNRQPPAPFELNLTSSEAQQVRSQPLGEDESSANAVGSTSYTSTGGGGGGSSGGSTSVSNDEDKRKRRIFREFQKNMQMVRDNNTGIGTMPWAVNKGSKEDTPSMPMLLASALQTGANMAAAPDDTTAVSDLFKPGGLNSLASYCSPLLGPPSGIATSISPQTSSNNTTTTATTQITTPSEVSQSTAISDRPKVKPVSKKDGKNLRKTVFPTLPLLQQNQMVSIYNNLPYLLTSESNKIDRNQHAIMRGVVMAAQIEQSKFNNTPMPGTPSTSTGGDTVPIPQGLQHTVIGSQRLHEALQAACSMVQTNESSGDAAPSMPSGSCESINSIGSSSAADPDDYHSGVNTQFKMFQMVAAQMPNYPMQKNIQRLFVDHPKSPTESPPANSAFNLDCGTVSGGGGDENCTEIVLDNGIVTSLANVGNNTTTKRGATGEEYEEDDDEDIEEDDDEEDDEDDEDDDEDDEDEEEDEENDEEENEDDEDEGDDDDEDIDIDSPAKNRKSPLHRLILSEVALKPDDITQAFGDFRPELHATDLVQVFPQIGNFKSGTLTNLQQQFTTQQATFAQNEEHFRMYENAEDDCTMYAPLDEPLEQFCTEDDGSRDRIYDITVDEIFQVIHDPSLQELTTNLNCSELADIGLNSICKARWSGTAQHIQSSSVSNMCLSPEEQNEQQRQTNQLLFDYQLQQQVVDDLSICNLQNQIQQTTLSLIPLTADDQQQAANIGIQALTANQGELQQQQQQSGNAGQTISQSLLQAAGQQQILQQQQQQQQILSGDAQQQTNYVFNVDPEKPSQSLQLLFQLPTVQQQGQLQKHLQQQQQQMQSAATLLSAQQQQLQQQQQQPQQQHALHQQQQQQQQQCNSVQEIGSSGVICQPVVQANQVTQTNLIHQQQANLTQQVLNQQALKQKQQQQQFLQFQQHQQQQQQQQQQSCAQHTQQVQVATQTQPAVNRNASTSQFCPSIPISADVSIGVCTITSQQQQQQQQQQQMQQQQTQQVQQQQQTSLTAAKSSGGIAKKAIDKASRKDRNRYALHRQTPAGSQANTTTQQYQQAVTTVATTPDKIIDVDSETDSNHDTALTLACAGGHEELVELLINRGANIEHRDKKGFTPLILAATAGHEKVVDILLKHGADLEAQSERTKDTPLSLACSGGRYEVVELLLSVSANKEHRNVSDYTPLSLAASGGYVNIIKLLLSNGAEINSRTGSKLGISPLMLAAMNGHTAAVKLLLDQGSDINAQIETNRNTALTLACFQGRHEVVSLLLDRKANVEHRAKTGLTPLMEAASGGYIEVGRVLLDKGADVNAAPVPTSRDTALTIAADKGHIKFVELLLSRGAAVEVKNKKGNSPLWLAAHGGHLNVVEILYSHHADIDSQDNRRVSCLMAAFRKGHNKVVKWMVQYVTQFPSDQEMNRFISTVSDKELLEKCYDCVNIIRAAKEAQAVKANKNASILLEELDMERTREESRRAAAARRRERKKKKKMEKKEEKRRLLQGTNGNENAGDGCDKDSEKEDDSDKEDQAADEEDDVVNHNPYREEGDSGIDQGSCSSTDIKATNAQPEKGNKNKNKKKKNNQNNAGNNNRPSNNSPAPNAASNSGVQNVEEQPPVRKEKKKDEPVVQSSNKNKKADLPTAATKVTEYKTKLNSQQQPQQQQQQSQSSHSSQSVNADVQEKASSHKREENNKRKEPKEALKQREKENLAPKDEITANQQTSTRKHADKKASVDTGATTQVSSTTTVSGTSSTQKQQQNPSEGGGRKSMVFSSRHVNADKDDTTHNSKSHRSGGGGGGSQHDEQHSSSKISPLKPQTGTTSGGSSTVAKRGEDGWKEVVRKSSTQQQASSNSSSTSSSTIPEMTCKKVQVPVNAISRVIGRAGSNINAIRATTGAHIEVEKQGKNQSERSITIKGLPDATKQAHMLISALIKDPDVDILQMLPRINPSIKPVPLVVNSWDKNTPLTQSSSSSTFTSSSTVTTTCSTTYPKSSSSTTKSTPSSSSTTSSGVTSKSSVSTSSQQSSVKSVNSSTSSSGSSRLKGFYQQVSRGSTSTSSNSASSQKTSSSDYRNGSNTLSSATKTTTTYTTVIMSQRNAGSKNQTQAQPGQFASAAAAASGGQTFAAKLSSNSGEKRSTGAPATSVQNQMSSSFHGSPKKSSNKNSGVSNNSNSMNHLNTLAGPIGTFNVADVAVSMAVASVASQVAAQQASSQSQGQGGRSITPIGQPLNTSGSQSMSSNRNVSPSPALMSMQSLASASTTLSSITAPALTTPVVKTPAIVPPLQSKIGNEYCLFNDTYQNQWESKPMYNPTTSDSLPKADASKAPGYNRGNVISSPVSSKASSSNSTSPPGNSVIVQPPNLNILPVSVTATSPGSVAPSISSVVGGQHPPTQQQQQALSSLPAISTTSTSLNDANDNELPNILKPIVGSGGGQNMGGSVVQPAIAPPPSGLAIQRPTGSQHRPSTSQIETPVLNFGPIGSNSGRNVPGAVGDHMQNSSANRYYDPIAQSNLSHQMNFNVDSLLPGYHIGGAGGVNGATAPSLGGPNAGPMNNNSGNPLHMSRLNPRASVFSQPNKSNQQMGGGGGVSGNMFHQNNANMVMGGGYNNGNQKQQLGGMSAAPGRPQSQPQTGSSGRWYPTNDYSGYAMPSRELLNLENGLPTGMGGVSTGSPAAMSPNNPNVQASQVNGLLPINQQQQPPQQPPNMQSNSGNAGVSQEDIRKIPRPIGTERASWKYNNYPNMNSTGMNSAGVSLDVDPNSVVTGGNPAAIGGPMPPWMMDKAQNQQQPPSVLNRAQNWMKAQYRYYTGVGDYHQPDHFHIMDYHTTVTPPSVNQAQPMNLIQAFQYPHYVGPSELNPPMPNDKVEMWDHHDKNTWPSNWTN